jgi:serine/threonine protein kinase
MDSNDVIKLIDFNVSKILCNGQERRSTFCGTPAYMAPEVILQANYDGKLVDIYSMGVCLFVMVSGKQPFDTIGETLAGNIQFPEYVSEECRNLIKSTMELNPTDRISISIIREHPWFRLGEEKQ